jgi:antitoxin component HigA of HigAB toxin-antitoxin module
MEINELTAGDLPEIGTPEVVTEILSGKRALHIHQIYALGKRFHVAPSTFL